MLPRIFLLAFLLISAQQTLAQSSPLVADPAAVQPQQPALPDTVRALHNLFRSRRNTGGWLAGGSAAVITITGLGTLADNNGKNCGGYVCFDAAGGALLMGIGTVPAWLPGLISLSRFSRQREQAAVAQFERTRQLPHYVRNNLAPRFFNENYRFNRASRPPKR